MENKMWMKWLRRLWIILIVVVLFVGLLYAFQERIIFHPQPTSQSEAEKIKDEHDHLQEVTFQTGDGNQLSGWLLHPVQQESDTTRLLIYYGGNAEELSGQISPMSTHLKDWSVLLVNYRGYGRSEGSPSEEALYADALMIYDEIHHLFDGGITSTVVMGRSLGTAVATKIAAERHVDGLILISPFDTLTDVARHHYPYLPVSWMLRRNFDSLSRVSDISAPLLAIAGYGDQIIPEKRTQAFLEHWGDQIQYELFADRHHNDIHLDARFWPLIQQFLQSK